MKNIIYILGNPIVHEDKFPLILLPKLIKAFSNISFIHYDPTEEFEEIYNKTLIFIDTVIGINEVTFFTDIDYFRVSPRNSVHDFDLPIALSLLKKLGKIDKLYIIGVPCIGKGDEIIKGISTILRSILHSENEKHNSCKDQKL